MNRSEGKRSITKLDIALSHSAQIFPSNSKTKAKVFPQYQTQFAHVNNLL